MSRKPRNFNQGEIYHIIQRGNNQTFIFDDQLDKAMLMEMIKDTLEQFPCMFLYYSLMDNHYHLVFQLTKVNLSRIMHRINLSYSKYYNKKYSRTGTIFGSRYTAYPVKDDRHFYALLVYLAFNPVKAKIVREPGQYHWCAHLELISRRQSFIDKNCLLSHFHRDSARGMEMYMALIECELKHPVTADQPQDIITEKRRERLEVCFQEMIDDQVMEQKILAGVRDKGADRLKNEFIRMARVQGYTVQEIARLLGITDRAVRYHLR